MNAQKIQKLIDEYYYWDSRALELECNYFSDEVILVYEDTKEKGIKYEFLECYRTLIDHDKTYDKLRKVKDMSFGQIPYFLQDVTVGEVFEGGNTFYTCKINMWPLNVEVWCKKINVYKINLNETD